MAIVESIAIGKAVNSIGNVTYQTVKGRTIAREKPLHVANPKTPAQVAQRNKMRNLVEGWRTAFFLGRKFYTVIPGYGSPYNQFIRLNMPYGSEPLILGGVWDNIPIGFYTASGKYGTNALNTGTSTGNLVKVNITDMQLREEIVAGDLFGIFNQDTATSNELDYLEYVITVNDVTTLSEGGTLDIEVPFMDGQYAISYYSPSRGVSSTARFRPM